MTLGLSPEQQELSDAVAQFAARNAPIASTREGFDDIAAGRVPGWWDALVANGFHAVHLPEDLGGQGGGPIDAACVLESAGKSLLPGPLLPTVTAGAVALLAEPTPLAESFLRNLASGATAATVLPDDNLSARFDGGRWRVTGASPVTQGVCAARTILLGAASDDGDVVWLLVDPENPAATVEPVTGTDLVADAGILRLDDYRAAESEVLSGIDPDRARCVAVGLVASTMAGIAQWCVEAVTAHLRIREQFGKVIGTFQALQHNAAMLLVNSELATAAAWDAVRAVDESLDQHRLAAAGAATIAVSPIPDLVLDALTMLGAIGFTWEHDVHLYWRRAISLAGSIGPANRWARRLGELACTQTRDMSVNLGDAESEFRSWVAETLDAAMQLRNDTPAPHGDYADQASGPQRTLIADAGLMAPHWPAPWGVGADPLKQLIIDEEFAKRPGLVRPSLNIAEWILPSVMAAAPKDLQEKMIPPTQRGEIHWCQLFSEPGAGSDLASLTTRATKVDGGWRINGHKIWTSLAQYADLGALLARTDPEASKHRGIGVVDHRDLPGQLQRGLEGAAQQHVHRDLGDAGCRTRRLPVEQPDGFAHPERPDRVGVGVELAELTQRVVAVLSGLSGEAAERDGPVELDVSADGRTLFGHRRDREAPAFGRAAEQHLVGNEDVVEEYLVEVGLPGRRLDRLDFDARRSHVEDEVPDAAVLAGFGVGAGQQCTQVGVLRQR
ncbi:acyl-CoA dehydrogenase, partial [Mycobacterium colombiense]|uniref:acyl-CoA dehydrogenase n=1 Tax=Mycobacterium colombiense TaxID=339268 RepID=UPI001E636492